jgi:hypothetical protein
MRPLAVLVVLLAVPLAGCAGTAAQDPASPTPTTTPAPAPQTVTVQRTGGIAGIRDTVTVQPDGSWRRTARGAPSTGTLTAGQNDALVRMEADPALAREAGRPSGQLECADGFHLSVTVGDTTVQWQDCGTASAAPPVASRIATTLLMSTR